MFKVGDIVTYKNDTFIVSSLANKKLKVLDITKTLFNGEYICLGKLIHNNEQVSFIKSEVIFNQKKNHLPKWW